MKAIFKREFKAYFQSMPGYVFLTIFMVLSGYIFCATNITYATSTMTAYFSSMVSAVIFIIPVLTMRLFSEDRKTKTDQLLITAPISITEMVLGKFFAAVSAFLVGVAITLLYPIIMSFYGHVPFAENCSAYIGFILFCASIISIGAFMSAITESQVIALISTYGVVILTIVINWVDGTIGNSAVSKVLLWISPTNKFTDFTLGVLNIESIIYYLSLIAVFLFLTVRVFEKRRWN